MRFDEFNKDARKQLAHNRNMTEDQLDEILPAIAAIARGAGAAAKGGAAIARGAGKLAARGAKSAIKTAAKSIGGRKPEEEPNDPNATVGGQEEQPMGATGTQGTTGTQPTGTKVDQIKPGKKIELPAGKNKKPTNFKITKIQGDDVEIENPVPKPGEPKKFTYKKQDLDGIVNNEVK